MYTDLVPLPSPSPIYIRSVARILQELTWQDVAHESCNACKELARYCQGFLVGIYMAIIFDPHIMLHITYSTLESQSQDTGCTRGQSKAVRERERESRSIAQVNTFIKQFMTHA